MAVSLVLSWEGITLIKRNDWCAVVLRHGGVDRVMALFPLRQLAEGYITAVTDDEDREGRAAYRIVDKAQLE